MASIHSVRLWTLDAAKAVASDAPGLAVLSPLMDRVTPALVEQAADIVLRRVEPASKDELLTVLGIFAEGVITPENLERIVSRERGMASTFIRQIFQDEFTAAEATWREDLQQMIEDTLLARFPDVPARLYVQVRQITDRDALRELNRAILRAADQTEAERILAQIGEQTAR